VEPRIEVVAGALHRPAAEELHNPVAVGPRTLAEEALRNQAAAPRIRVEGVLHNLVEGVLHNLAEGELHNLVEGELHSRGQADILAPRQEREGILELLQELEDKRKMRCSPRPRTQFHRRRTEVDIQAEADTLAEAFHRMADIQVGVDNHPAREDTLLRTVDNSSF